LVDSRGINLETCNNNQQCIRKSDTWDATGKSNILCVNNQVYKVTTINDPLVGRNFYRYEIDKTASFSTNGVCNTGYTCSVPDKGCISNDKFVSVNTADFYEINKPVTGIYVKVLSAVANPLNSLVTAILKDNGQEIVSSRQTDLAVNGDAIAYLNLGFTPIHSGDYSLEVTVRDKNTNQIYTAIPRVIKVVKGLTTILSCPTDTVVGRDIPCTITATDPDTNAIILPTITIKDGSGNLITNYQYNSGTLVFQVTTPQLITVSMSASQTGYMPSSKNTTITVNPVTTDKPTINLDNKDIAFYSQGIKTGTYAISYSITESGLPIALTEVKVAVKYGSTYVRTYTLTQDLADTSRWAGSIDLPDAGQTYYVTITPKTVDPFKQTKVSPYPFSIATTQSTTGDVWSNYAIIIAIAMTIVLSLGIVFIVIYRKRRSVVTVPIQ